MDLVVAIDFDGTLVTHEYPDIGRECPGAVETVRWLQSIGAKIVLWTMRSGETLDAAVGWMEARGLAPWGINTNPTQRSWSESPKAYAQIYIDDAAIGCPLILQRDGRPYVDWLAVRLHLEKSERVLQLTAGVAR